MPLNKHLCSELRLAQRLWGNLSQTGVSALKDLVRNLSLSVTSGDLLYLDGRWYVTHAGLLRFAARDKCSGIRVQPVREFCKPRAGRWTFKATVYKSRNCKGFVGYGDADPSNVSALVRGAEMRVAETRAVNRALRKAYGIGVCSVEEIGSLPARSQPETNVRKLPPQPVNGSGQPKLRDQLYLLIRQHRQDPSLVSEPANDVRNLRSPALLRVLLFLVFCPPCQDRLAGNLAPLFWREIRGTLVTTEFPQSNGVRVFRFLGHSLEKPISNTPVKSRRALDYT